MWCRETGCGFESRALRSLRAAGSLIAAAFGSFHFSTRLRADEPLPATRAAAQSPAAVDSSSLIDVLAQHEAHFAAFHVEYVSVDRRDDGAAESEERVEFARDAQAGRWFRKRNVTGSRYGVFARLVIIDRHGDVVGSCS